jgi:hypothetical protein
MVALRLVFMSICCIIWKDLFANMLRNHSLLSVGPILGQREAYVDLWCSCQIGDAYIDLSIHLFDTYTRRRVNAAPLFNPKTT